jgi:hypothetical protein
MSRSLRALETFFSIFKHSLTSFRRNYASPPDWGLGREQEIITVKLDVRWGLMGEERKAYRVLVGKQQGKRPLGRPRMDGIRMKLMETGWGSVEWIQLAQ